MDGAAGGPMLGLSAAVRAVVIGCNPCVQKSLWLSEFKPGEVNRAARIKADIGGKGQLFSRASQTLVPGAPCCVQFVGGQTGDTVVAALDAGGIRHADVRVEPATRTCTTLLCADGPFRETELIEPSGAVTLANRDRFLELAVEAVATAAAADSTTVQPDSSSKGPRPAVGLAIMGTCPESCGQAFYAQICEAARKAVPRCLILVDGYKAAQMAALDTGLVDILKINVAEFAKLAAASLVTEASAAVLRSDHAQLSALMAQVCTKYALEAVALTDGGHSTHLLIKGGQSFRFEVPEVQVANAIGCGDTVGAGLLLGLLSGLPAPEALRVGLAAACAAAQTDTPATFSAAETHRLLGSIQARTVNV